MCCIIFCETVRVPEDLLTSALRQNSDGTGFCWRSGNQVMWRKGVSDKQAHRMAKKLPLPYAIHCRMATVGGKDKRLSHPFPIEEVPDLSLKGSTDYVLMHNGHITYWKEMLLATGYNYKKDELWSDSSALAHVLGHSNRLEMLDELGMSRFLVFGHDRVEMVGSWHDVEGCKLSSLIGACTISYGGHDSDFHWNRRGRRDKVWTGKGFEVGVDEEFENNALIDYIGGQRGPSPSTPPVGQPVLPFRPNLSHLSEDERTFLNFNFQYDGSRGIWIRKVPPTPVVT